MKGLHRLTASAMALFLAASFISYTWSAPQCVSDVVQERHLKEEAGKFHPQLLQKVTKTMEKAENHQPLGKEEGRRFISDESQRKDLYDRLQLETRSQNTNAIALLEAAAPFLNSLRKAQEAEEETNDHPGYLADILLNW